MQINSNCKSALKYKKIDKMHTQMKKIAIFGEGILQKTVHFVESCLFHGSHRSCEDNLCATCIFSMLPVDQKMMFYWDMH